MIRVPPGYEAPNGTQIWRYLDFTKFVSLLETESLYYSRADLLGDPLEGSYPKPDLERTDVWKQLLSEESLETNPQLADLAGYQLRSFVKNIRSLLYVSCWHANEHESAAMWRLYLKSDEGIAIQSTTTRLESCLQEARQNSFLGKVKYIDYNQESTREPNVFVPFLHKRKSFEHELEVRAIFWDTVPLLEAWDSVSGSWKRKIDFAPGRLVKADLAQLIERVYVAPTSARWFYDLVKAILGRYGHKKDVIRSELLSDPLW